MKHIFDRLKLLSGVLCLLYVSLNAYAEDADLAKLFQERNVTGTIVISYALDGTSNYIHNLPERKNDFCQHSKFNTLIALEEKVITDEKEIITWTAKDKGWKEWNKDQSLENCISLSCVWFYQN